ncbi:hypothetical protein ACWEFL_04910 [Streptomyces sp. NPDC004838]
MDEPLTGGDVTPLEVLGGHPGELVDRPALGPLDEHGPWISQPAHASARSPGKSFPVRPRQVAR